MSKLRQIASAVRRRVVAPPLGRAAQLLLGYDVVLIGRQTCELAAKVDGLTRTLDILVDSPEMQWLYKNRATRMDASVEMFDARRREFHLARYRFAAPYVADRVVADIACGTGYGTELLAVEGRAQRVIGVDIDARAIQYARATHMPAGAEFRCASGDATEISDESVDVVVSFEAIEHVPSDTALLAECHRILRPGGTLVCSTPNNWPLEVAPDHVRVYDSHSFRAVLENDFTQITLYNQNSGHNWLYNRGQPAGICGTTKQNEHDAECYIAVCRKRAPFSA